MAIQQLDGEPSEIIDIKKKKFFILRSNLIMFQPTDKQVEKWVNPAYANIKMI